MLSIYPIGDGINGNDAREILLSRPFLVFEMEITVNSVTLERFYRFVCIYIYIYIYSFDVFIFQTVYRIKFLLSGNKKG